MASRNGLQQLQLYNEESSNNETLAPAEYSGRLLNEEEMDFHTLHNTMYFLLHNPTFGTHVIPERLREMFNTNAAAERYPYTFDETNARLLRNSNRRRAQEAGLLEDGLDLSELKPDISHNSPNTDTSDEHEVVRSNSGSPILIRGESSDEEDEGEDNQNPDESVQQSGNPENVDTESNDHQPPEGSPVGELVENPEQAAEDEQPEELPNNSDDAASAMTSLRLAVVYPSTLACAHTRFRNTSQTSSSCQTTTAAI